MMRMNGKGDTKVKVEEDEMVVFVYLVAIVTTSGDKDCEETRCISVKMFAQNPWDEVAADSEKRGSSRQGGHECSKR